MSSCHSAILSPSHSHLYFLSRWVRICACVTSTKFTHFARATACPRRCDRPGLGCEPLGGAGRATIDQHHQWHGRVLRLTERAVALVPLGDATLGLHHQLVLRHEEVHDVHRFTEQAAAIAAGFAQSSGEIMAWINSDDRYQPGAFERVAKFFLDNPSVVFADGYVNLIDASGSRFERLYAVRPNRFITAKLGRHSWPQQGCFWRRSAYQSVGGVDSSFRFCMDRDLFIRLSSVGPSRRIPGPPLADFRTHEDAKSSTILDVAEQESNRLLATYGTWKEPGQRTL